MNEFSHTSSNYEVNLHCAAFDIGNVLVDIDFEPFIKEFNKLELYAENSKSHSYLGVNLLKVDPMVFLSDLHAQQDLGLTTIDKFLRNRFNIHNDLEGLLEAWDKMIIPNERMLDFVDELKESGVIIALLSNMGIEHTALIREKYPRIFDGCVLHLSYEVGARKPSKLYFQSFLTDHPEFKGCVYVDDLDKNLDRGAQYGFNAYKFELDKMNKDELESKLFDLKSKILII